MSLLQSNEAHNHTYKNGKNNYHVTIKWTNLCNHYGQWGGQHAAL